jgi:hypothetical protein
MMFVLVRYTDIIGETLASMLLAQRGLAELDIQCDCGTTPPFHGCTLRISVEANPKSGYGKCGYVACGGIQVRAALAPVNFNANHLH